ncbi:hypothetical protein CAPTEDRAFT_211300 [Capitella teleta]|uniref:Uncharacterized protein n=1 Tax=Capitella teleta TaxID=283909 RepID=R7TQ19_CAPTE|nr:hypothetical protein CAPTEDRAFT_211300 [Capitella teleta]|eukprot:ELT93606.1 hypothetical protein CAPTEDRAFT_211300 [Capitella teleta]
MICSSWDRVSTLIEIIGLCLSDQIGNVDLPIMKEEERMETDEPTTKDAETQYEIQPGATRSVQVMARFREDKDRRGKRTLGIQNDAAPTTVEQGVDAFSYCECSSS